MKIDDVKLIRLGLIVFGFLFISMFIYQMYTIDKLLGFSLLLLSLSLLLYYFVNNILTNIYEKYFTA